jgi:hypothetical protein
MTADALAAIKDRRARIYPLSPGSSGLMEDFDALLAAVDTLERAHADLRDSIVTFLREVRTTFKGLERKWLAYADEMPEREGIIFVGCADDVATVIKAIDVLASPESQT